MFSTVASVVQIRRLCSYYASVHSQGQKVKGQGHRWRGILRWPPAHVMKRICMNFYEFKKFRKIRQFLKILNTVVMNSQSMLDGVQFCYSELDL